MLTSEMDLKLFVYCLKFSIDHQDFESATPYCVLTKDGLYIMLFQDEKQAKAHYTEIRLVTKNINEVFQNVSVSHPHFLHPNLNEITLRPWGAKEFAIWDKQVGIRFQQW